MRTLYLDQVEVLDNCRAEFRAGNRSVLLLAPTGFGKTVVGAEMVSGAANRGNVVWFLNHRRELVRNTSKTFHQQGIAHGVISSGWPTNLERRVQVCSVGTVIRRLGQVPPPTFIIPDEAHHVASASWSKIVDYYPDAKILGLTATPWRLDGVGLGRWFNTMVEGPALSWLIANGRLSPYRLFAPSAPDLADVKTMAGDYERHSLSQIMDRPSITGDAIDHYLKLARGRRAVTFCCNIEHSKHVAAQFQAAGVPAAHIDGTMDDERDRIFAAFERGEIHVLTNVDIVSEGVDVPGIECVILLRPTKSLTHYLQSVGRGLRLASGKPDCVILDHAGNSLTHGFPDDEREWSLEDRPKRKSGEKSEVAIRTCSECFAVFRPVPACPNCGHVHVAQVREIEQVEGELTEIDVAALRRREMQDKKREQGQAETLEDLIRIGRQRGQRNPEAWARHVLQGRVEAQQFADSIGLTPMQVKAYRKEGMPAASKGAVAALMWIRAEKPTVFSWIEREHPEVFTGAVLREIADERVAA